MTRPAASILRDHRVWLLGLIAALAVALGFFSIPDVAAIRFVSRAGFWLVLAAFALFARALWMSWRAELREFRWRSADWPTVAIIAGGGTVLLVHETFGFKIVMDEIMLLGTSMSMHFDKTALTPTRGNDIQGVFVLLDGLVDKRPLFFPFLVSLLHDLTGYRPANAFVLNGALTFVFLALVNAAGRLLAGRLAGWLGVALFAGLPLLGQNATGGGFELLNLAMILATMLLGARYVAKRDAPALEAFCFSALLLAQVRYESVIYLPAVAFLVVWIWYREGRAILSWPLLLAPLLMVHCPLQHRIFELRAGAWELASRPGATSPFSLSYLPDNLSHALKLFFGEAANQPNSLVLSALGCLAVPFFALLVVKRLRSLAAGSPIEVATTIFALGFAAQFALMMCYFLKFDEMIVRRLSLPTHLGMVIAIFAVLPQLAKPIVLRTLLLVAGLAVLARGVPSMAAHAYNQEYLPGRETAWRRQFIADQPRNDYLMIDNDSILWIAHQVSATPVAQALARRDSVVFHLRNRTFSDVFVFQHFEIDPETSKLTVRKDDDLGPAFVLETVREERLKLLTLARISRVKAINEGETALTIPDPATRVIPADRAAIEKHRRDYLENFMRKLP